MHPDQSVFITTEENTFLGYIIDSVRMIFTLIIIAPNCCRITKVSHHTVRELAQTIGTLMAAFTAVPLGQFFYRRTVLQS